MPERSVRKATRKPISKTSSSKPTAKASANAKNVKTKAKAKASDMPASTIAAWIECASSVADAMRHRWRNRVAPFASDVRFATLAREVWAEHPDRPSELLPLLDTYLAAAGAYSRALDAVLPSFSALADRPEDQHVHLPRGAVRADRIRAANVTSAKA